MSNPPMRVILGASSLKAYVTAPKALHVIGIVRFGQEYGLLATNAEGTFFRVNGSQIAELDADAVHRAIDAAARHGARAGLAPASYYADTSAVAPAATPRVTVRKHRHAEAHTQTHALA